MRVVDAPGISESQKTGKTGLKTFSDLSFSLHSPDKCISAPALLDDNGGLSERFTSYIAHF